MNIINKQVSLEKNSIRKSRKLFLILLVIYLSLSAFSYNTVPASAQSDQAYSKLQSANTEINKVFIEVFNAEAAGADVANLIEQLNVANDLLAQAENAYRQNDFTVVIIKSDGVLLLVQQVNSATQYAKQSASNSNQTALLFNLGFTLIGGLIFIIFLFLIWNWFKHRYVNNLLKEKSEVQNQ
jgi:CHASE3 domain sensor protein